MTPIQKTVLDEIVQYRSTHGYSPTIDELRCTLGVSSKSVVHRAVALLVRDGHLVRTPHRARGLRSASEGRDHLAEAARRLLGGILEEDPEGDRAVVRAADLGDLDIALAEMRG